MSDADSSRPSRLISPRQLAIQTGNSYEAIRKAVKAGTIPSIQLGARQFVRADALELPASQVMSK